MTQPDEPTQPDLAAIRDTATDDHLEHCSCAQNVLIILAALEAQAERLARALDDALGMRLANEDLIRERDRAEADLAAARVQHKETRALYELSIEQRLELRDERDQARAEAAEQRGRAERMEHLGETVRAWLAALGGMRDAEPGADLRYITTVSALESDARAALAPPEPVS